MHQVIEVCQVLEWRGRVPVRYHHLTQYLVRYIPPLAVLIRQRARLHNPWQEQVQGGHELWKRGRGMTPNTDTAISLDLKEEEELLML
jgi:hypothetical protein